MATNGNIKKIRHLAKIPFDGIAGIISKNIQHISKDFLSRKYIINGAKHCEYIISLNTFKYIKAYDYHYTFFFGSFSVTFSTK